MDLGEFTDVISTPMKSRKKPIARALKSTDKNEKIGQFIASNIGIHEPLDAAMDIDINIGNGSLCNSTCATMDLDFSDGEMSMDQSKIGKDKWGKVDDDEFHTSSMGQHQSHNKRHHKVVKHKFMKHKQSEIMKHKHSEMCYKPMMTHGQLQAALLAHIATSSVLYIELMAGAGVFTKALLQLGVVCVGLDHKVAANGPDFLLRVDLALDEVVQCLMHFLDKGKVLGVGGGLCCTTLTLARRGKRREVGKRGGFPIALRNKLNVWGLPDLPFHELQMLRKANAAIKAFLTVLVAAVVLGLPCWVENPERSYLWQLIDEWQPLQDAVGDAMVQKLVASQCMYGKKWRKDTTVMFWNAGVPAPGQWVKCCGPKCPITRCRLCQRTHMPHEQLTGFEHGEARTSKAAEYSIEFAMEIAKLIKVGLQSKLGGCDYQCASLMSVGAFA